MRLPKFALFAVILLGCAGGGANGPLTGNQANSQATQSATGPTLDPIFPISGMDVGGVSPFSNALAPNQPSGAPSPKLDPEGNVKFPGYIQHSIFVDSEEDANGQVKVHLQGVVDLNPFLTHPNPNVAALASLKLEDHLLRVFDPEENLYVDAQFQADANEERRFFFDAYLTLSAKRFADLKNFEEFAHGFLLVFRLSSPTRDLGDETTKLCPDDFGQVDPWCGSAKWGEVKMNWKKKATAGSNAPGVKKVD